MDAREAPSQRPDTLDITMEDGSNAASAGDSLEAPSNLVPFKDNILPQEESIDLGGAEFATPHEDSSATPSESLMDRLNDQMMESVMISDSPNNSEEEDVAPMDSFLDGGEDLKPAREDEGKEGKLVQSTTDIKILVDQQNNTCSDEDTAEQINTQEESKTSLSPQSDHESLYVSGREEPQSKLPQETLSKDEPVPVCTIFSQSTQPKSLVPDGFQPTLIKSPSFSMGSDGANDDTVTPRKQNIPLMCQPSPSLSKFFTDNGQANPASDFFDSFTTPSSFISISNPNAEVPPGTRMATIAPTPEHQLSSTSSSISSPGGSLNSGPVIPSPVFFLEPNDQSTKPNAPPTQTAPPPTQSPVSTSGSQEQPFNQLQAVFSGTDDPFATALSLSEVDRRHDAWLPSEETRKVLISVATQQYSPAYVESSRLTMPGLKFDNLQVGNSFVNSLYFSPTCS